MRKCTLKIGGMRCAACSGALERRLNKQEGIEASVNLALEEAYITYDEKKVDMALIETIIKKAGFEMLGENAKPSFEDRTRIVRLIIAAVLDVILLYVAMGPMIGLPIPFEEWSMAHAIAQIVLVIPIMICGYTFFTRGFGNIFRLRPNMDSLVAMGTTASFLFSLYNVITGNMHHNLYFEGAGTIVTLVMFGKTLEYNSKKKSAKAIEDLVALQPFHAVRINEDGSHEDVNMKQIYVGDILLVKPGEQVPVDGEIIEGHATINESMLTGESIPADKTVGDKVFGSTLNNASTFKMKVTTVSQDSALQNIIKMVKEAQGTKAPIARIADEVSLWFVPVVMGLSLITLIAWLIGGVGVGEAIEHAVAVLVIACPCALGLATPIAIMVGSGKGAKNGILFRNAEALETLGKSDIFVFDKTGTLTEGKLFITKKTVEGEDFELLKRVEALSEHPIAKAIAGDNRTEDKEITDFKSIPGFGCSALYKGKVVLAGNTKLLDREGITDYDKTRIPASTMIYLAYDGVCKGYVALADTIREDSRKTIQYLKDHGKKTVMITGDNEETAKYVSDLLGIDKYYSSVLPEMKQSIVKELKKEGKVLYVGDGINDSPALAEADTALSVSSASDVAMSSSSVILISDKLEDIITSYELSRFTMRNIRQNLFWAFFYNALGIPLAAGVLTLFGGPGLSPMLASLAMSFSSVTVVGNALRINTFKKKW